MATGSFMTLLMTLLMTRIIAYDDDDLRTHTSLPSTHVLHACSVWLDVGVPWQALVPPFVHSPKSDAYSFGVLLWEAFESRCGAAPWASLLGKIVDRKSIVQRLERGDVLPIHNHQDTALGFVSNWRERVCFLCPIVQGAWVDAS